MRYIDIDELDLPDDWETRARRLTERLENCTTHDERMEIIRNNPIWGELRTRLSDLSNGKCWYSEAQDVMSFKDVDHFRPKGNALELDKSEREGYWWLAFEWRNYRFSSEMSNRPSSDKFKDVKDVKGKHDYFPLRPGSHPATRPTDDTRDEHPYLLDPCDEDDCTLLSFDDTGMPIPTASEGTWAYQRAEVSIRFYHLDYSEIVKAREQLWKETERLINETENLMQDETAKTSGTIKNAIKANQKRLRTLSSQRAELSSAVRACLLSSEARWARAIATS